MNPMNNQFPSWNEIYIECIMIVGTFLVAVFFVYGR